MLELENLKNRKRKVSNRKVSVIYQYKLKSGENANLACVTSYILSTTQTPVFVLFAVDYNKYISFGYGLILYPLAF